MQDRSPGASGAADPSRCKLSFLTRIFGEKRDRGRMLPLYRSIVAAGRDPAWYREGQVPDTLEGRFDMIAALLSIVLLRLEKEGDEGRQATVLLTEIFVEDMDGTIRQLGIGDLLVGKHIGRMMSALGGRLGAFRAAAASADYKTAVRRNIFRDSPPSDDAVGYVAGRLAGFEAGLAGLGFVAIVTGKVPAP